MKKAFALTVLLALVLTGCGVTADVTDPTDNSYQTYPTTTNPAQTDPTKDTAPESTTVPAETEGKTNEKDALNESEAATEPTTPSATVPGNENTDPTEGTQETKPPKQTEPTEPVQPPTETSPTVPTEPETNPTVPTESETTPTEPTTPPTTPPTEPPETDPTEPAETEPTGCAHNWKCIHHAEEGHWRAGVVCDCGWATYGSADSLVNLWNAHATSYPAAEALFDHGGYGCVDEWIVDKPAYDEWVCHLCGEKKE